MDITITISDDKYRILEYEISNPREWLEAIVDSKIFFASERIIYDYTEYQPSKLTYEKKKELIDNIQFKSKAERDAEILIEFQSKS